MLTVVVSTFNRAERLGLCLYALRNQKDASFEVIVVDDGSSDTSAQVVRRFADDVKFPVYYVWQQDIGFRLSAARNLGAKLGHGWGFVFIDADILLKPTALYAYALLLAENDERVIGGYYKYLKGMVILPRDIDEWDRLWRMQLPEVQVAQQENRSKGRDVRELHYIWGWASEDVFADESRVFRAPFSLLGGNMMIPRRVWEKTQGFDETFTQYGGEDAEFSIQVAQAGFGFSYSRDAGGCHMAHAEYPNSKQLSGMAEAYIKTKWPAWFRDGQPIWEREGWQRPT